MKKLEEILRDKPIKNKLSFVFRIMDILYVVLALVAVVELIQSKGYIGSIIVVVLLVLAIIFNASMSKMLAKMLIDPITNLVAASEKIGAFTVTWRVLRTSVTMWYRCRAGWEVVITSAVESLNSRN